MIYTVKLGEMSKDYIKNDLQKLIMQRIAILDGGMGTTIRSYGLDEIAARGERFAEVKKDILNSLKVLNSGGVIMLHDCLPNNFYEQAVPRCQDIWNGDVWKAIVEVRTYEYLDTYTCYADYGIGIILKRKNRSRLAIDKKDFSKLRFIDYYNNFKQFMNVVEFNELNNLF